MQQLDNRYLFLQQQKTVEWRTLLFYMLHQEGKYDFRIYSVVVVVIAPGAQKAAFVLSVDS